MSTIAVPRRSPIPGLLLTHARHTALRIAQCEGYHSPDGTHFTLCADLDGDSVTATLKDGRILRVIERAQPAIFTFSDGVRLTASYTLVDEEAEGAPATRSAIPHSHMSSMDYLVLELANDLVRTHL